MKRQQVREDFDRFVDQSTDQLLRTAYLVTWDLGAAQDLVQECLVHIARRWPRVRAMAHPRAYARRVLVNLALDDAKRRARHRSELEIADRPLLEDHPDQRAALAFGTIELGTDLVGALGALPPRQRAVLVLRYFDDLSERQTAEAMGCSIGTVKSTTARALERLRALAPGEAKGEDAPGLPSFALQPTSPTNRSSS